LSAKKPEAGLASTVTRDIDTAIVGNQLATITLVTRKGGTPCSPTLTFHEQGRRDSRRFAPLFFKVRAEVRAVGLNRLGLCGREPRGMPLRNDGQLQFTATGNHSDKCLILWPDVLANDNSGEKTWIEGHDRWGI
jgi:hypothetical protein